MTVSSSKSYTQTQPPPAGERLLSVYPFLRVRKTSSEVTQQIFFPITTGPTWITCLSLPTPTIDKNNEITKNDTYIERDTNEVYPLAEDKEIAAGKK